MRCRAVSFDPGVRSLEYFMERTFIARPHEVVRYDIVYYDLNWNEIERMKSRMRTWHQVLIELDHFNGMQQGMLSGMTIDFPSGDIPMNVMVEVCYVEV